MTFLVLKEVEEIPSPQKSKTKKRELEALNGGLHASKLKRESIKDHFRSEIGSRFSIF